MDSRDMEPWQAERIQKALRPKIQYLRRLRDRMEKVGFLPDDPLFRLVTQAHDALHHLGVELHYLNCKGGVGRKPKRGDR